MEVARLADEAAVKLDVKSSKDPELAAIRKLLQEKRNVTEVLTCAAIFPNAQLVFDLS